MDLDESNVRHALKIAIALTAIAITLLLYLAAARNWKRNARTAIDVALIVTAVASVFAYFEFGWLRYGQYMNPHDCFHYYMGAKYSTEHHYFNLYRDAYLADAELGPKYTSNRIRDLDTHQYESTAAVASRKNTLLQPFTPQRWAQFKTDIAYFRTQMPPSKWNLVLQDKGYNATPVWNAAARILTNAIPTTSPWGMRLLTYLDLLLLIAAFTLIGATFGWRAAALAIIFHGTNYFMSFVHIKGAILRLDWVVATVAAFCLLYRKHYKTAGFFMAIAACSRVFPLLFAFPLGCKMLWNWYEAAKTRRYETPVPLNYDYIIFFDNFVGTSFLLIYLSIVFDAGFQPPPLYLCIFIWIGAIVVPLFPSILGFPRQILRKRDKIYVFIAVCGAILLTTFIIHTLLPSGLDLWKAFFAKIAVHNADISTTRVGFKYIFLESATDKAAEFQQYTLLWRCILLAALALTAFLARKIKDHETIALGFIPIFFLTAPTFYYYVMLIVPFLYFATRRNEFTFTLGTILFYAVTIAAFTANYYLPQHFTLMILLSWLLFGLCFYIILTILFAKQHFSAKEGVMIAINQSRYRDKPALFSLSQPISPNSKQNPLKSRQKKLKSINNNANNSFDTHENDSKTHKNDSKTHKNDSKIHKNDPKTHKNDPKTHKNDSKTHKNDSKTHKNDSKTHKNDSIIGNNHSVFDDNNAGLFNFHINYWTNRIRFASKQIQFRQFLAGFLLAFILFGALYGAYCFFLTGKPPFETNFSTNQATNPQKDTATLVFVGDIMLSRGVTRDLEANGRDYTFPFEKTAPYTKAANLAFCNLEGPISGRGQAIAKKYTFNAPPESIEGLQYAGFDAVSVANNHILDFGTPAFEDTTAALGSNAIYALGLSTEDAPQKPFTATYNGIKVGMLAYCDPDSPYGSAKEYSTFKTRPASATRDTVKRDIETLRPQCDIVAVSIHWGIEYKDEPDPHQRELGRYIIDCGANLVIGHHPHVLQPFEAYKGGLIAYSLGNFVFDQRSKPATRQSRLLQVKVNRAGVVAADYLPLEIPLNVWQPTPTQAAFIPIPLH